MERFVIQGGRRLEGTVRPGGNKNAILPILAATILLDAPIRIENVPAIRDVATTLELLEALGATVERLENDAVRIDPTGITAWELDDTLCRRIRASILFAGPLLARFGRARLSPPGGDVIGRRRLDTHFLALEALGARIRTNGHFDFDAPSGLEGADVFFDEPSVTATENAIMAAVRARGRSTLRNVATEPHVQELCRFLVAAGARIDGIGSNVLTVHGTTGLATESHRIGPDHIEIGSWIALAGITGGQLRIDGCVPEDLRSILQVFERFSLRCHFDGSTLVVPGDQELVVTAERGGGVPRFADGPWPNFPSDLLSIVIVVAVHARGTCLIHEKMFESRLFFVDGLIAMGAHAVICDPHRVVISGPARLYGQSLESPDVRAGMAMLLAGLAANGRTTIGNIHQIERGYARIDERIRALGGVIERVSD